MNLPNPEFEKDKSVDGLETDQMYYNLVDGDYLILLAYGEDIALVADLDGEVEVWDREGTIFNPESVWKDIIPVKWKGFNR